MKFIVSALWQHENPIDEEANRDYMAVLTSTLGSAGYVEETIWYKIDEKTHGSVANYKSEEAYHAFLEKNEMQRDYAKDDRKVTMIVEYKGPAFAVQSDVD